jgi:hypothetical protein
MTLRPVGAVPLLPEELEELEDDDEDPLLEELDELEPLLEPLLELDDEPLLLEVAETTVKSTSALLSW